MIFLHFFAAETNSAGAAPYITRKMTQNDIPILLFMTQMKHYGYDTQCTIGPAHMAAFVATILGMKLFAHGANTFLDRSCSAIFNCTYK